MTTDRPAGALRSEPALQAECEVVARAALARVLGPAAAQAMRADSPLGCTDADAIALSAAVSQESMRLAVRVHLGDEDLGDEDLATVRTLGDLAGVLQARLDQARR